MNEKVTYRIPASSQQLLREATRMLIVESLRGRNTVAQAQVIEDILKIAQLTSGLNLTALRTFLSTVGFDKERTLSLPGFEEGTVLEITAIRFWAEDDEQEAKLPEVKLEVKQQTQETN